MVSNVQKLQKKSSFLEKIAKILNFLKKLQISQNFGYFFDSFDSHLIKKDIYKCRL